jgi:hypothetical protein
VLRRPRTVGFQFAGIQREFLEPMAALGNGGPLWPFGVLLACALMAWAALR